MTWSIVLGITAIVAAAASVVSAWNSRRSRLAAEGARYEARKPNITVEWTGEFDTSAILRVSVDRALDEMTVCMRQNLLSKDERGWDHLACEWEQATTWDGHVVHFEHGVEQGRRYRMQVRPHQDDKVITHARFVLLFECRVGADRWTVDHTTERRRVDHPYNPAPPD